LRYNVAMILDSNDFKSISASMGEAGVQVTQLGAAEGSAGNISVFVPELSGIPPHFRSRVDFELPLHVPHLAGGWVLISATGRRLRDLAQRPDISLCVLRIHADGRTADLLAANDVRPTSETNSHLAIHNDRAAQAPLEFHAVVHAQPVHISYMSHVYRDDDWLAFNRRLLRWQPETIIIFPDGIGLVPFQVPGSPQQMDATLAALRLHRLVVWQFHGTVSRSEQSVLRAADFVEYAETAARYEYMNLQAGSPAAGLSPEE